MYVRSFRLSDYSEITELLANALSEVCYEETKPALARQLSWDSELILVAVKEERIVGLVIGTIDQNDGYYYRLGIHKNYRRQGVGRLLVRALKQRFEQRKVRRILINVDEHNQSILPLYESEGYKTTDLTAPPKKLRIVSGH